MTSQQKRHMDESSSKEEHQLSLAKSKALNVGLMDESASQVGRETNHMMASKRRHVNNRRRRENHP